VATYTILETRTRIHTITGGMVVCLHALEETTPKPLAPTRTTFQHVCGRNKAHACTLIIYHSCLTDR
jgi:hypothetical protein